MGGSCGVMKVMVFPDVFVRKHALRGALFVEVSCPSRAQGEDACGAVRRAGRGIEERWRLGAEGDSTGRGGSPRGLLLASQDEPDQRAWRVRGAPDTPIPPAIPLTSTFAFTGGVEGVRGWPWGRELVSWCFGGRGTR